MTLENLTQAQKIAIEGEVAKALVTAKHNAEILYRLYTIMKSAPKDVAVYVIEAAKKVLSIDEVKLNRVLLEACTDDYPYWIWIERTVQDLKLSLTLAIADGMLCNSDIDKKLAQQMILKSAFVYYCRSISVVSPEAALRLCRYILDEEPVNLGFLSEVCFSLIHDISGLENKDKKLPENIFHSSFDIKDMLSFSVETKILSDLDKMEKKPTRKRKSKSTDNLQLKLEPIETNSDSIKAFKIEAPLNGSSKEIADTVNDLIAQIVNEQISKKPPKKHERYAVVKKFKGETGDLTMKVFNSSKEAEEFIKEMKKEYPTMFRNCEITIKKVS